MNARLLLALALLTLVGLGAAVWLLDEPAPPPAARPTAVEPAGRGTPPPAARPEPSAPVERPAPEPSVPEARAMDSEIVLPALVEGRVVDRAGQPLEGAHLSAVRLDGEGFLLVPEPTGVTASADAEGRFALVGVPTGVALGVEADHPDQAPRLVSPFRVAAGTSRHLGDIVLDPGFSLKGTVSDAEGLPLSGARVTLRDVRRTPGEAPAEAPRDEALTGADGAYAIPHLARRQYQISVEHEGYAPVTTMLSFVLGSASDWTQDFALERADHVLAGRVTARDGTPVPDVGLRLVRRTGGLNAYFETSTRSGPDGAFRFEGLPEGLFEVGLDSPDWYLDRTLRLAAGRSDHEVFVRPAVTVVGQLQVDGEMPAAFRVTARPDGRTGAMVLDPERRTRRYADTDPPGSFRFDGLRPGTFRFEVVAAGFAPSTSSTVTMGGNVREVSVAIPLWRGGEIVGRLDPPREKARVELRDGDWDPGLSLEAAFPTPPVHGAVTQTDGQGRFRLEQVPQGRYVLTVRPPGAPPIHVHELVVGEGGVHDVGTLRVVAGGAVRGTVTGLDGRPAAGVTVRLAGDGHFQQTQAAVDGSYAIEAIPPGDYRLEAVPADPFAAFRYSARADVSIESGAELVRDLVFSERSAPGR